MGVINITPDSFSDGGLYLNPEKAINKAAYFVANGADILDLGAQSTRPGATEVGVEIELNRLIPVLTSIRQKFPNIIISIDTYQSEVAKIALDLGADWINDISGGRHDPKLLHLIYRSKCPYVITHSRGNSKNMNDLTTYGDVLKDVYKELQILTRKALDVGVDRKQIIWDPGIGFAKNTEQNIILLRNLREFKGEGYPLLVGPSRKRFIGDITNEIDTSRRVWGTLAVVCKCIEQNVDIIRVHDVEEVSKVIKMGRELWP